MIELKVPAVGESVSEVQIGEWLKREGDHVERDETIVKIETDKVTVDLPAPSAGTLSRIVAKQGQMALVGDVIGLVDEAAGGAERPSAPPAAPPSARAATPSSSEPPSGDGPRSARDSIPPQGFARVMPSARRALKERGIRQEDVEGSGPGGRVLREDVLRVETPVADAPVADAPVADAPVSDRPRSVPEAAANEEVVAMSPFRRRIAERLVGAQQAAALLTTFNEIDMSAVSALRKEHQEAFVARYGTKLGFMSFFVKAVIDGLKLIPAVNAEIRGTNVVYKNHYDIGVAVGGGKGLAVPVIRSADRLSFSEIELKIQDFGKRAKENRLSLDELAGGTFTISNGGVYGSLLSTPIVNPPQSGILGLHAIQDRPVALNGAVVIRPMMYIALTYDHRIVDGREAVTFLKRIKECLEQPARMLVEV